MQCAECNNFRNGRKDREGTFYCNQCWDRYDAAQAKTTAKKQPAPKITALKDKGGESRHGQGGFKAPDTPISPGGFDVFESFLGDVTVEDYRRVPNSTGTWIDEVLHGTEDNTTAPPSHRIVSTLRVPSALPQTNNMCASRSPRGAGSNFKKSSIEKGVALLNNPQATEDVLCYLYATTDEELLHVLVRILDEYTNLTETEAIRMKPKMIAETIEAFGTQQTTLVDSIFMHAKAVLRSLLVDFMHIDIYTETSGTSVSVGPTIYFKQSRHNKSAQPKQNYYDKLVAKARALQKQDDIETMFERDFSSSGMSMPRKSVIKKFKDHVQFSVPAPKTALLPQNERISIKHELPGWAQPAFEGFTHLNTVQTKVFPTAFHTDENMLVCAPTGAGKTNIALLVMLRQLQLQMSPEGILDKEFKIVYVAPMKALAAEMVDNFSKRLAPFAIIVRELTGDMQLTKKQIAETQVIVTTPEKWDVVTRKQSDNPLVASVRLIIIDEVHLLNDDRGPVIEAIVARTLRTLDIEHHQVRLVALSATLPNYLDVAHFLRVDPAEGLKVFGPEYRPVPLAQTYVGVKTHVGEREKQKMYNELMYDHVFDSVRQGQQVMVFVHSRRQTVEMAEYIRDQMQYRGHQSYFFNEDIPSEIRKKMHRLQGRELNNLVPYGIAVHHAGMARFDRTSVEDIYRSKYLSVIVCTATLAWGVNLPAHTVIIRGTQIYDAKRGGFVMCSALDVMQIFGRAGRPQYDTSGHGIIISGEQEIHHYLRMLSHALPIESKLQTHLADHLNAEINAGTVTSIAEGVRWLEYTYFWQRMKANPLMYGVGISDLRRDHELKQYRYEIVADAARLLETALMVRYNEETGSLDTTDLGRIGSHYYISHATITTFNELLMDPVGGYVSTLDDGEVLNIVASASEFSQIRVRPEEMEELSKITDRLPGAIRKIAERKESVDDNTSSWKVVLLLKAYISRVPVEEHSLVSDMSYIIQNAGRICRALFEIELQRNHPQTTYKFFTLCKCVERRTWDEIDHPLRQYDTMLTDAVLQNLERKRPSMSRLLDMDAREIGDLVHNQRFGPVIKDLVVRFPNVSLDVEVSPITRTILRVKITVTPDFKWTDRYHGTVDTWWLFIEDQDGNMIFHHEVVRLARKEVAKGVPTIVNCTIPILPEHDTYTVSIHNEKWIGASDMINFCVSTLQLPEEAPPHTKLLPVNPLTLDVIPERYHKIYRFKHLNPIQSQTFHAFFHTDENILLGAPTGSGKTICAEMAVLRVLQRKGTPMEGKIIYIAPLKALVRERMKDWSQRFEKQCGLKVVELTGDVTPDISALSTADILCTTPEKWDGISRNWQNRSYVTAVSLVIFDEIHMLGSDRGPIIEVIVSRMRYISWHTKRSIRLVGLSTAVANPSDLSQWLGIQKKWALFNFEPSVRPVPMRCHIAGYPGKNYCPRMATMNKPTYTAIIEKSPTKPVIVFVSSRRQTRLTSMALINFMMIDNKTTQFVRMDVEELTDIIQKLEDPHLKHTVQFGIGMHHAGLPEGDKNIVEDLFRSGKLQILVATSTLAWGVNFPAHLVVVKGTEFYDAKTKSYIDFPITDVLQMMGRAGRPQYDTEGIAQVLVHEPKKSFYKRFLYDPFPVESYLHRALHVHINAELVSGVIRSRQDAIDYLTWTYLFRRLLKNPSYYGLEDNSPQAITRFLSNLIQSILFDLEQSHCLEPNDEDEAAETDDPSKQLLRPTLLGKLCSYYYLHHYTAHRFDVIPNENTDSIKLLELICQAEEFESLPVRHNEDKLNMDLARSVPLAVDTRSAESPHVKAHLLLQAHFTRCALPISDYFTDTRSVLENVIRIVQALVDIVAKNGYLFTALRSMQMLQCVVQGRWWHDNTILQLPHVEKEMLPKFAAIGVDHICDVANSSHATKKKIHEILSDKKFGLTEDQVEDCMQAARQLPLIDVHISTDVEVNPPEDSDDGEDDKSVVANIELTRLSAPIRFVAAPRYPKGKDEQFWAVIGCDRTGELIALKRINRIFRRTSIRLVFDWDEEWDDFVGADGKYELFFYLICDSYIGMDQQYAFRVGKPQ
eukprot:PhM_4_TR18055/c0_g1_i1/m.41049/K18663/ASCC3; activating signal cointegrator complex subunit 3